MRRVHTERTFPISGAHVRLELEPAGPGCARVVKAYRRLPGMERAKRAPHLELEAPIDQLHLDASTIEALARLEAGS